MDHSKKFLRFPDCKSPRGKAVSCFGLGVAVSFVFLCVLLFNISFGAPLLNPMFQGFDSFGSNSSSFCIIWPLSFSSSSDSSSTGINARKLRKPVNLMQSGKTHQANVYANWNFMSFNGSEMDFEDARLSYSSEKVKNRSFNVEQNAIGEKSIEGKIGTSASMTNNLTSKNHGTLKKEEDGSEMNDQVTFSDQIVESLKVSLEKCDIFDGRWVRDDTKPYYPAGSCPHIDRDFDCYLNRRPDNKFVKWRWQPNGCDIPRGKKLAFVGDSLNRNMWESLVCILRHSVKNKERVYEISGKKEFKKKGFYAFKFADYNCTVDFVSSPFLVRESSFDGQNGTLETLRLDLMDHTTSMYHDADVLVFNTGHWWTHEKTSKGEDYYHEGSLVHPKLEVLEAYKRALGTWARWVDKSIDGKKTQVIFRGYSFSHFRGGHWNSRGQCDKETEPVFNKTHLAKYPSKMRALEHVLRFMRTPVTYLNISKLTDLQKGRSSFNLQNGIQEDSRGTNCFYTFSRLQPLVLAWSAGYLERVIICFSLENGNRNVEDLNEFVQKLHSTYQH